MWPAGGGYSSPFQFHFGSIGRLFVSPVPLTVPCFNSTLVRLEDNTQITTRPGNHSFQFHFGSIGSEYTHQTEITLMRFNSTLVRLEVPATIFTISHKEVSIPLWFDWKNF